MAAVHGEAVLRQRVCLGGECHAVFFICAHCDRGQRYCSTPCREHTRVRQRRCANSRHQQCPEGRLDHRDRQRDYRCRRQVHAGVTDQGSLSIISPASFEGGAADPQENLPIPQSWPEVQPALPLRCRICGRIGRLIDPFPRTPCRKRVLS
jgi:hypothetical protein